MHDIHGKPLYVGNTILTYTMGMLLINSILEEHDFDKGGALIECVGVARGGGSFQLRTHADKVIKIRTWAELAREAIEVQDASNLSGVLHSFAHTIVEVRTRLEAEGFGSTWSVNTHPVCCLFSSKIASLTGGDNSTRFTNAYNWAKEAAKK